MHSIQYVREDACVINLMDERPQADWYINRYIDSPWTYWGDEYDTAKEEYRRAELEMYEQLNNLVREHGKVTVHPMNAPHGIENRERVVITLCDHYEKVEYYVVNNGWPRKYDEDNVVTLGVDIVLPDIYNDMLVEW